MSTAAPSLSLDQDRLTAVLGSKVAIRFELTYCELI